MTRSTITVREGSIHSFFQQLAQYMIYFIVIAMGYIVYMMIDMKTSAIAVQVRTDEIKEQLTPMQNKLDRIQSHIDNWRPTIENLKQRHNL